MSNFHLDNDFLVTSLAHSGPERKYRDRLAASDDEIAMSAVAWYEFMRGPRTPEQVAVARDFLGSSGVLPLTSEVAELAAVLFQRLGKPRRRIADLAIAATAILERATLVTLNARDFEDVPGLHVVSFAD